MSETMGLLKALRDVHLIIGLACGLNGDKNVQCCPHKAIYRLHIHVFLYSMSHFKEVERFSANRNERYSACNDAAQSSQSHVL